MEIKIPTKYKDIEINTSIEKALQSVYEDKYHTLILGEAGTGKSVFLNMMKEIDQNENVRSLFIAPTGIAAVNIKGATIHSTFSLGIHPRKPEHFYPKPEVRELLQMTDKLVIDEISMCSADLLDTINHMCKVSRESNELFGGIQMIGVGDVFQLSPIIDKNKEEICEYSSRYDGNPFFFGSDAYRENSHMFRKIKFDKIYRQENGEFKEVLNRIRRGIQTSEDLSYINNQIISHRRFDKKHKDSIYIAPFNRIVDEINEKALAKIEEPEVFFSARITGNVNQRNFMAPTMLKLRKGCKIMLLVNDPEWRFQNGTMGVFERKINNDTIQVRVGDKSISVSRWDFEEYEYKVTGGVVARIKKGTFCQIPVKLAFAISAHKSQGLTFEEGYIDFAKVFAEHLSYVMLSRFRDINKIGLKRGLQHADIKINQFVLDFMDSFDDNVVVEKKITTTFMDATPLKEILEDDIPF